MNRNYSAKLVVVFSLLVMVVWLAGSGCKGRVAQPPPTQQSSDQPPTDQPPADPPPTQPGPAQISVSSRLITSGNIVLNNISSQTVTVQNTGSSNLNIGQIAQSNPLVSPFSITSDKCSGKAVLPSASCTFAVQFGPTSQGTFTDSFDIPSDASNETAVTVDVEGSGNGLRTALNQVSTAGCSSGILEVVVTVMDLTNTPLTGLTAGDFQVQENGVPQTITNVSQLLTPIPVSVTMLLDYTTSMQSQIPTVESASKYFVGMLNAEDEAAVIKFAQAQQLMQDFTGDAALLTTAIDTPPSSIGRQDETRLYDALWFAAQTTAGRQKSKAIVALTDGKDVSYLGVPDVSVNTLDQVIAYAIQNSVEIYPVGLGDVDAVVMNRLANETMGQYFHITSTDQLAGVYEAIREILSGKYSIQYVTSSQGSAPITLDIGVTAGSDQGGSEVRIVGCP